MEPNQDFIRMIRKANLISKQNLQAEWHIILNPVHHEAGKRLGGRAVGGHRSKGISSQGAGKMDGIFIDWKFPTDEFFDVCKEGL